ncbi:MAG: hypothetical protein ACRENK_03060 [Gemmatimonadaceae bacterium]
MTRFLFVFALFVAATPLSAQRRQRVSSSSDPSVWISGGIAGFTANGVNDGASASSWDFGNSTNLAYGASLEKAISSGTSVGISASYAKMPFSYFGPALPAGGGATCDGCDAHLDMTTLVGTLHAGGTVGIYQVIELNAGIVMYRNLTRDSDHARLAPVGGNIDPYFSLGYGIGYGLSKTTQIEFVPDAAISIHERSGLSNGVSNTNSMRSLRLAVRMGF